MKLIDSIVADAPGIAALRRDLHAHPELCFEENRTSDVIARTLEGWGIEVHRGFARTGVVGVLRHGRSSRAVGLRADIDALPITEENRFLHASQHAGRMHACGHDGHTAMLLGAAQHLARQRHFDGTVYLVFQPAEEGGGGAQAMIRDGLFERFPMEAMFGAHNWPGLPVGQFALRSGPAFASNNEFRIEVVGRGAHAAMPNNGIDPIPVACQMVQAFQTILTRNVHPLESGVISVTIIHAGETHNVIPNRCVLEGTVRAFSTPLVDVIEGEAQRLKIARELAASGRRSGRKLYLLDEPTTGLHLDDVRVLIQVLDRLVDQGHTVVVIEHHLDVIKRADWIIDMGPEAGPGGGTVVAEGTPEQVAAVAASHTGRYLREVLADPVPVGA